MAKNDNMLSILWMLNSGSKITAGQMAEKLELNIRTVYRYIDALCASGIPIISEIGQNGGYYLQNNFIHAPLYFDIEEQKALLHAAEFIKEAGYPCSEALKRASSKLKLYSNEKQITALNRHLVGFEVINRAISPYEKDVLEELEHSAAEEYSVEISYRSKRKEQPSQRVVDPYGIVYWNNKWYMVGFCHLRSEIRSFRVERILQIKHMQRSFQRPETFSAKEFLLQNILPEITHETSLVSCVIRGRAEALDDLCIHWFFHHHLMERSLNEAVFSMDEQTMHAHLPYFLLPYGKSIQVIEPQSLKQKLVSLTSELLKYYQS